MIVQAVAAGLAAGSAHVALGPDHLAAVAPLATEGRRRVWLAGLMWGVGHACGAWVLALLAAGLREFFHVDVVAGVAERLVGVLLVLVGLWGLRRVVVSSHPSAVGHHASPRRAHLPRRALAATGGAFVIGLVHGTAGVGHLIGALPAAAFATTADRLGYALAYGSGAILTMLVFSSLVGLLANRLGRARQTAPRVILSVSSTAALLLGAWLIYAPGSVDLPFGG